MCPNILGSPDFPGIESTDGEYFGTVALHETRAFNKQGKQGLESNFGKYIDSMFTHKFAKKRSRDRQHIRFRHTDFLLSHVPHAIMHFFQASLPDCHYSEQ
jgi:hypothetical protein